jgi:hypothetical protein
MADEDSQPVFQIVVQSHDQKHLDQAKARLQPLVNERVVDIIPIGDLQSSLPNNLPKEDSVTKPLDKDELLKLAAKAPPESREAAKAAIEFLLAIERGDDTLSKNLEELSGMIAKTRKEIQQDIKENDEALKRSRDLTKKLGLG